MIATTVPGSQIALTEPIPVAASNQTGKYALHFNGAFAVVFSVIEGLGAAQWLHQNGQRVLGSSPKCVHHFLQRLTTILE
jgi:hypothetical protein